MLLFQMEGAEAVIAANDFALWRLMAQAESENSSIVDQQIAEWSENGTDALQAGTFAHSIPNRQP